MMATPFEAAQRGCGRLCALVRLMRDEDDRLRLELLNATVPGATLPLALIFGSICAAIASAWVSWPRLAVWYGAIVLYPLPLRWWRRRVLAKAAAHGWIAAATGRIAAAEIPFHLIWVAYVPLCWVAGDGANNAYLTIFMMGSVASAVRVYGPCYRLSLPAIAVFLPFAAIYAVRTGTGMDLAVPLLQVAFLGLLILMALHHYWTFRESDGRLMTIGALVKNLAEARDEAERANTAKSAFLASMSHELRTPLNAIIGFSDMIRQGVVGPVQPRKYGEYAEDIFASGQHLLCLINDVLDLSKIEAGKRALVDSEIDPNALARNAALLVRPQADKAGVAIRIDVPKFPRLIADERAMSQVLVNFLSNAVKFSPPGECVTVFARGCDGGGLELGVVDHGIGMDADGLRMALEPYGQVTLTSRETGTGLGLPISKALVEAHGAAFHIESTIGSGTSVWACFPAERVRR